MFGRLTIEALPFCHPQFEGQSMQIGWNDHTLTTYTFRSCEPQSISIDLPADQVAAAQNTLSFAFTRTTAPRDVGMGNDGRNLAVGFKMLTFRQQNER